MQEKFTLLFNCYMKANDKKLFSIQAEVCKALANSKRLEIIHALRTGGRQFAAELMKSIGLTKANLSQHMRVLQQAGVVASEREGTRVRYELASPKIGKACELLREFLVEKLERNGALAGNNRNDELSDTGAL